MAEVLIELPQGTKLDDPMGWVYRAMYDVWAADALQELGFTDLVVTPQAAAAAFNDTAYEAHRAAVVVDDADPHTALGTASAEWPLVDNTHVAWVTVRVHPDHRRRGIGTNLLAWAQAQARAAGRGTWQAELSLGPRAAQGPQVPAPEGGSIAADTPGWVFAQAHGYQLEQVERMSVLPVPVDEARLSQIVDESSPRAADYRLHVWVHDVPDRWRAGFAAMRAVFNDLAPAAGLEVEAEVWDEARVTAMLRSAAEQDTTLLLAAVEHVPSGVLVAETDLWCPNRTFEGRPSESVGQGYTLVLPGHRGHGLGRWVKAANLQQLAQVCPTVRRVHTWNASENEHMLAINTELGFRVQGYGVLLQKKV